MPTKLTKLKLEEVSLVDVPANPKAQVTLFKRAEDPFEGFRKLGMEIPSPYTEALAQVEEDKIRSQIWYMLDVLREKLIQLKIKIVDPSEFQEKAAGELLDLLAALDLVEKTAPSGQDETTEGEDPMSKELEKKVGDLEGQVAELTKSLKVAIEAKKAAEAELKKRDAPTPETIEVEGEMIEKATLPASVLKALETKDAELKKMQADAAEAELKKRASEVFSNLPGGEVVKAQLLAAVEAVEGSANILTLLKSVNEAAKGPLAEIGKKVEDTLDAKEKLEKMAKDYAAKHNVAFEQGFAAVVKTPEGQELRKSAGY